MTTFYLPSILGYVHTSGKFNLFFQMWHRFVPCMAVWNTKNTLNLTFSILFVPLSYVVLKSDTDIQHNFTLPGRKYGFQGWDNEATFRVMLLYKQNYKAHIATTPCLKRSQNKYLQCQRKVKSFSLNASCETLFLSLVNLGVWSFRLMSDIGHTKNIVWTA